ncbi:MAG TPA: aryl-sulfate sulfotransferase [Enterococcus columbae]|nr:aryl-sulfate sulfotransferase [Enterococcus columbae]
MKKLNKRYLWYGLVMVILLIPAFIYLTKSESSTQQIAQTTQTNYTQQLVSTKGDNIQALDYSDLNIDSVNQIYNVATQEKIQNKLLQLTESTQASFSQPLIVSNPYLTNTTGLYIAFFTDEPVKISYEIKTDNLSTYENELYNSNGEYSTTHQYQLIGSIANQDNLITLYATNQSGEQSTYQFHYTPPKLATIDQISYETTDGQSTGELSDGLYAVIGNKADDSRATYLVDNDGYIRAEIPIINYNSMRLTFNNQQEMYFALSTTKIAKVNRLGQVLQVIDLSETDYLLHHDYILTDDNQIIALATSKSAKKAEGLVEDRIIKIDLNNNQQVSEIANFKELLPDLYNVATDLEEHSNNKGLWDPVHLNSIQQTEDGQLIISSRETSTIIKLKRNEQENYNVEYLIGDTNIWKQIGDTGELLLEKVGNFTSQFGQHSITYETSDQLADGQYYLYFFNNNSTIMDSRSDFSLAKIADKTAGKQSKYMKYLVDENTKTYQLVQSFDVPYSAYVSSVQQFNNNIIVDSGQQSVFAEYDANGSLIRSFGHPVATQYLYRVFKYDFKQFYFN